MRPRGALAGIDGEVEEDLDEIGAVDLDGHVLRERADFELIVSDGGMNAQELAQIGQELVDADARGVRAPGVGGGPGNGGEILDAVGDLADDDFEALLDKMHVLQVKLGGVANPLADDLRRSPEMTGQRPVDVVDDAGVDLAAGLGELLVNAGGFAAPPRVAGAFRRCCEFRSSSVRRCIALATAARMVERSKGLLM